MPTNARAKQSELFERLEPPPGGLADLRARLRRDERRRRARLRFELALATGLAVAVVWLVGPFRHARPEVFLGDLGPTAVACGPRPLPSEPVSVPPAARGELAVRRVPTQDTHVVFYLVGTTRD